MFKKFIKIYRQRHPVISLFAGLAVFTVMYWLLSQMMIANVSIRPAYQSFVLFLSLSTGVITTGTIYYFYATTVTGCDTAPFKKRFD